MTYRIEPLRLAPFTPLFAMSDTDLAAIGARRMVADAPQSAPCRVSLTDAEPGGRLILVNHAHVTDPRSPYRAAHAIFVREDAVEARPFVDAVPDMLTRRLLSVRVFDGGWMMTDADVVEGVDLDGRLIDWCGDPAVAEIHIHTARRGCYMARAVRSA